MRIVKAERLAAFVATTLWVLATAFDLAAAQTRPLRAADILPQIEAALMEKGAPPDARVRLAAPDQPLPIAAEGAPAFDSVSYNPRSGRFLIRASSADGAEFAVIAGAARSPVDLPVLIAPLARGEEIVEGNIAWITSDEGLVSDAVFDAAALIGAQARRPLNAGVALRKSDLAVPTLVKKGALVAVTYAAPGLALSQMGLAQSNGARGDVVDIEIAGVRTIRAVVAGANTAEIAAPRHAGLEQMQ